MSINSDLKVADCALTIEKIFGIDMSLEEMFSDDLNNYFNYEINENNVTFYFETDEGSCKLICDCETHQIHSFNKTFELYLNSIK